MGSDFYAPRRSALPEKPPPPPPPPQYRSHHRRDVPRTRPADLVPQADADRLPETPVDEELVRQKRIEAGYAFLATREGRPYREIVDVVRDFGGEIGPNWFLTASNDVKCWEGTAPSNPALDLRQQIMNLQLGANDPGEIAVGKAFEVTFDPPSSVLIMDMWRSYDAWASDGDNLRNRTELPGDWAVDERNPFAEVLFGRPIYTLQDFETIRLRINSAFSTADNSGTVQSMAPSQKAFVNWCLATHLGTPGAVSSRMIAHAVHSIQPAHQVQCGVYRDSRFHAGVVERYDSNARHITSKICCTATGSAVIEIVARIFKVVFDGAYVKRKGKDEVVYVDGRDVKVHFRIGTTEAHWQGEKGSFLYFPIEHATNWSASGNWELREAIGRSKEPPIVFPKADGVTPSSFETVDYSVAVPWLRQMVNTHGLPLGFMARMMALTMTRFENPFDLSWLPQLTQPVWSDFSTY